MLYIYYRMSNIDTTWLNGLSFFFKQKTAYEMRISDWSSDVCSSDLHRHSPVAWGRARSDGVNRRHLWHIMFEQGFDAVLQRRGRRRTARAGALHLEIDIRSEEHTSELQSLMRISYAVFCLKKKKQYT